MADPNVQYQLVTGAWAHVAEDGIIDEDPYPDLVRPSGSVRFEPYMGSNEVIAAGSGFACTVGVVRATISDGVLKDVQDRIGVWLAAFIDGAPVWWTAHYEDLNFRGTTVPSRGVVFAPSLSGVNITSLTDAGDIDPGDIPSYQNAQQSAAMAAASALEAKGYRDQTQTIANGVDLDRIAVEASTLEAKGYRDQSAVSAGSASGSAADANASKVAAAGSATASANSALESKGYRDQAADIVGAGLVDGQVTTPKLADGAVTTVKIGNSQITSAKIVDGTIATADLADSSVTSVKIADGTIVAGDLASNAVTTVKILDANVTTAKVADSAITSAKIADGTIVTADLADSSVTTAKIVDGTITNVDISATAAIALSKLETGRVRGQNNGTAVNLAVDCLTQAQYDAIGSKDANTVYLI